MEWHCKFNGDIWGEMKIIDTNIIIKNYQKKWEEHLERITNIWILKLSYLNKLKCSSARDICQKDGIVSTPIIRADKQNNLWWLFSFYSSKNTKFWTYRLYISDKLYDLIKQYFNYLYSYTEYSTVMTELILKCWKARQISYTYANGMKPMSEKSIWKKWFKNIQYLHITKTFKN